MSIILRKHEPLLGHIPLVNVVVTGGVDIYEDSDQRTGSGPYLIADFAFQVGPVAVPRQEIKPLANGQSLDIPVGPVPVALPFMKAVTVDLEATIVDYNWHAVGAGTGDGVAQFNIRLRADAWHLAGVQIALIPVVISLMPQTASEQDLKAVASAVSSSAVHT